MHSLLLLLAVVLAWVATAAAPTIARRIDRPDWRVAARFMLLVLPPLLILEASASILLMIGSDCFVHCNRLDQVTSVLTASGILGYLGWRVGRFLNRRAAMGRLVARLAPCRSRRALAILRRLAPEGAVELRVVRKGSPMAFVYGHRKPVIVLSSWLLRHLDDQELEAALAHEMSHVRRRDGLMIGLATLCAQIVPLTRHQDTWLDLIADTEELTDQHAVRRTKRPGALASALLKMVHTPTITATPHVLALTGASASSGERTLEHRIMSLVGQPAVERPAPALDPARALSLVLALAAFVTLWIAAFCQVFMSTAHQVIC